jgi:hypothetical protein
MSASPSVPDAHEPADAMLADFDQPVAASVPVRPAAPPPPPPVEFPLEEMVSKAPPSMQYLIFRDVVGLDAAAHPTISQLPLASVSGLRLAVSQRADGGWGAGLLAVPAGEWSGMAAVGLVPGVRRLLALGWPGDAPPIERVRRLLFRLVSEDSDPSLLGEFAAEGREAVRVVHRQVVREAAAVALAQAGFEADPRLRGALRRVMDRWAVFLRSPAAQAEGAALVAAATAGAGVPTRDVLLALGAMPRFRSEQHQLVDRMLAWVAVSRSGVAPRRAGASIDGRWVLGDPLPSAAAVRADVPAALSWLELVGRLGALRRPGGWSDRLEELLASRDADGWWRPARGDTLSATCADPSRWPGHVLSDEAARIDWSLEVTTRLAVLARLAGRVVVARGGRAAAVEAWGREAGGAR